jgi:hypothetical protein
VCSSGWSGDWSFHLESRPIGVHLRFLLEELPQILDDVPVNKRGRIWFQRDEAPPSFSREVRTFLNDPTPGRWIGREGPHSWPVRSPDLSPLGYYALGLMKEMVGRRDALLCRTVDKANQISNSQRKLQQAKRGVHNWAVRCVAAESGIVENLPWTQFSANWRQCHVKFRR